MGSERTANGNQKSGTQPLRYIIVAAVFFGLLFSALLYQSADADTAPDTLTIHSVNVSQNLKESGDLLYLIHYEIAWDDAIDYSDLPSDETHIIQLISGSQCAAATTPYPYYNNGYAEGVASFYFNSDQAAIIGLQWGSQYTVRITGQLNWVTPVESYDYVISDTDYCPTSNRDDNRAWVKLWILDAAQSIETDWGVSSALSTVSIVTVLSEVGETYFLRVVPGLRYLCPDLFTLSIICPSVPADPGTYTHAENLTDRSEYDGTMVENGIETLGNLVGGNETLGLNLAAIALIALLMGLSFWKLQNARPGMLLGLYTLPIGAELRFTELVVVGFIALLYTLFTAKILFWDKG